MSKKTLLSEAQIQRFMKLANMPALGRPLTKTGRLSEVMDDPEGLDPVGDVPPDAADMADEAPPAPMDDMGAMDASGVDIEGLVTAIVNTISDETGVPIEVEGEGSGEVADDMAGAADDMGDEAAGPPMPADDMGPEDMALEHQRRRRAIALEHRRRLAIAQENRLRHYVRNQVYNILEGEHSKFSDNRQSSAGQHHTGGGKAKASKQHMGGNSAALPLEESVLDQLTRRVAARLLDASKK